MAKTRAESERQTLLAMVFMITVLFALFLSPMRSILIWAASLAVIFGPMNEKFARRIGNRNWSSLLTVSISVVTVMVPISLVVFFSSRQLATAIAKIGSLSENLPHYIEETERLLSQNLGISINLDSKGLAGGEERIAALQSSLGSHLINFGGAAIAEIISIISTIYIMFFFIRDWRGITQFISGLLPLSDAHKSVLSREMVSVISATLRGTIIVAAIQSCAAGLFYYALGIHAWALFTALTFFFCLIPAVGSGAIWVPLSIYFLIIGEVAHFWIMVFGGLFVIGMIDNFLKPRLIGNETSLPAFLIFLTSFGGLFLMGIDGLLLGPLVAKLFIVLWTLYNESMMGPAQSMAVRPDNDSGNGG